MYHVEKINFDFVQQFFGLQRKNEENKNKTQRNHHINKIQFNKTYN